MVQIFCDPSLKNAEGTLLLEKEQFHHIVQVLRLREGECFGVTYRGETAQYRYTIEKIGADGALCRLLDVKETDVELPCRITVLQGLPKADKMETVITKSVELGADRIVPVVCKRSVLKLEGKKADSRLQRWMKISESAAEQSHRAYVPEVSGLCGFKEAIQTAGSEAVRLIAYELAEEQGVTMEDTRRLIHGIRPGDRVEILIGPEGGFTEEEVRQAAEAGFAPITLGRRILRTETAAMTILSWLVFHLEARGKE